MKIKLNLNLKSKLRKENENSFNYSSIFNQKFQKNLTSNTNNHKTLNQDVIDKYNSRSIVENLIKETILLKTNEKIFSNLISSSFYQLNNLYSKVKPNNYQGVIKNNKTTNSICNYREKSDCYNFHPSKISNIKINYNKLCSANTLNKLLPLMKIFFSRYRDENDCDLIYSSLINNKLFLILINTTISLNEIFNKIYQDLIIIKEQKTTNTVLNFMHFFLLNCNNLPTHTLKIEDKGSLIDNLTEQKLSYCLKNNYISDILMYKTYNNTNAINIIISILELVKNTISISEFNNNIIYEKEKEVLFSLCEHDCVEELIKEKLRELKLFYTKK